MKWLLMFAGAFVGRIVGLILIILVVWFLIKWWFKRKLSGVVEQFQSLAMLADTVPPFRIELQPGVSEAWNEDLAQPLYEPLLERGFVDAGAFQNESTPNSSFSIKGFASPELGVWAAVFHHEQAGYWLELVTQNKDETTITFSTCKDHGMDQPEYSHVERRLAAEPEELLDEFLAARNKPTKPVDPENFADYFCQSYARSMDWRIARGGVTREEVVRQVEKSGETDPDKREQLVGLIQSQWRTKINEFYDEQLRENFIKAAKMEPAKWEKIREKLVFVHDSLTGEELFQRCEQVLELWEGKDDEDDQNDALLEQLTQLAHQGTPRTAFLQMAEALASRRKVAKFGTIKRPVLTDVYGITSFSKGRTPRAIEHSDE